MPSIQRGTGEPHALCLSSVICPQKFHCFSAAFRGQKCAIFQANQVIPGCVVILMCSVNGTHTTWKSVALSGTFWVMVAANKNHCTCCFTVSSESRIQSRPIESAREVWRTRAALILNFPRFSSRKRGGGEEENNGDNRQHSRGVVSIYSRVYPAASSTRTKTPCTAVLPRYKAFAYLLTISIYSNHECCTLG